MKHKISLHGKTILVTGCPGFIGANLVMRLLTDKDIMDSGTIISLDNMNNYYDPKLKEYRLSLINTIAEKSAINHVFIKGSIADKALIDRVFIEYKPDIVVNLAAQAGVRYSIDHPDVYIESNIVGFYNILEACRNSYSHIDADKANIKAGNTTHKSSDTLKNEDTYIGVQHLIYASSSSVYGGNKKVPFSTEDKVDNPVSLYAATKKSDELLAHAYSKLYDIPSTGLRFFTVYGPAGRPDMFYYTATDKLVRGEKIKIFNYGNMKRDFTYIDDIVEGIIRVMQGAPEKSTGEDGLPIPPYALYNIGGGQPENLLDYISILQEELVRAGVLPSDYDFEGHRELVGMQPGDVPLTYADNKGLEEDYGFVPRIGIREGLRKFAEWYKEYYNVLLKIPFEKTASKEDDAIIKPQTAFCIICRKQFNSSDVITSLEHIIPEALGNERLTTYCVCKKCNNELGTRVDAYLTNHIFTKFIRQEKLAKDKDIKLFDSTLQEEETGKKYHVYNDHAEVVSQIIESQKNENEGLFLRIEAKNKEEALKVARKRIKRCCPNWTDVEIAACINREGSIKNIESIFDRPVFKQKVEIDIARWMLAAIKIAYEYACEKIGEKYTKDDNSIKFSKWLYSAVQGKKEYTDQEVEEISKYCKMFDSGVLKTLNSKIISNCLSKKSYIIILCSDMEGKMICNIRILNEDLLSFVVLLSRDASKYIVDKSCIISIILENGELIEE